MTMTVNSKAVQRLTALWALSEAGMGGFLHAVKVPFKGTLISSVAVMIICLIAYYSERKMPAIVKAVTIVLIIKMMVSPHSPLMSCFAVGFQAVAGAVLFSVLSHFRSAAFLLGVLSLLECALQRILFLTILYGNSLWDSINIFIGYLAHQTGIPLNYTDFSPSYLLIFGYMMVYLTVGVFVGILAGSLPKTVADAVQSTPTQPWECIGIKETVPLSSKPRNRISLVKLAKKYGIWLLFIIAILTFLAPAMGNAGRGVYVVLRTIIALLIWYFVLTPILLKCIRKKLEFKEKGYSRDIRDVLELFPCFRSYARQLWNQSEETKGMKWASHFIISMMVFALYFDGNANPPAGSHAAGTPEPEPTDAVLN
ncbi:hypothetical protein JXA80_09090 [bacterium]|nr:hypothetical protein [candidate division CSSED10-310 bacterium]